MGGLLAVRARMWVEGVDSMMMTRGCEVGGGEKKCCRKKLGVVVKHQFVKCQTTAREGKEGWW